MTFVQIMALFGVFVVGAIAGAWLMTRLINLFLARGAVVSLRLMAHPTVAEADDYSLLVDIDNPFGNKSGVTTVTFRVGPHLNTELVKMFDAVKKEKVDGV